MARKNIKKSASESMSIYLVKLLLVMSVMIGVGLLAGVTSYAINRSKAKPKFLPVVENRIPQDNKNVDVTSDWKIYKNERHGFEFRYPQNWKLEDTTATAAPGSLLMLGINSESSANGAALLEVKTGTDLDKAISAFMDTNCTEGAKIIKNQIMTLGNIDSRHVYFNKRCVTDEENPVIFARYGSETYIMVFLGSYLDNKNFDRVLTTFKFTQADIAADKWYDYKNKKYGFAISYPSNLKLFENESYFPQEDASLLRFDRRTGKLILVERYEMAKKQNYQTIITNNSPMPGGGTTKENFSAFKSQKIGNNNFYYRAKCMSVGDATCEYLFSYWLVRENDIFAFNLYDTVPTSKDSDADSYPFNLELKKILATFKISDTK